MSEKNAMSDDTRIEVDIADIKGDMRRMKEQQQDTSRLLETVGHELREQRILLERSSGTAEAIRNINDDIARRSQEQTNINQQMLEKLNLVGNKVSNYRFFVLGLFAFSSVFCALIVYIYLRDTERAADALREVRSDQRRMDERLDRIEIHMAGDRDRPYTR